MDSAQVKEKQRRRWEYLRQLYLDNERTAAGQTQSAASDEIARAAGLTDAAERSRIEDYLADRGLIELIAFGPLVRITHRGVEAVENALAQPDQPTEHFAPIHVISIGGDVSNSQIQVGGTRNVQSSRTGLDLQAIRDLLPDLRAFVGQLEGSAAARAAQADVDSIAAQLERPEPRAPSIAESLRSLRAIAEEATGGIIAANAPAIVAKIVMILHTMGV